MPARYRPRMSKSFHPRRGTNTISAGTRSPPRRRRTREGIRPSESSWLMRWEISRLRRWASVDWGAALGEREDVRNGIDGYGRERRKLLMLKEAAMRARGWSLHIKMR